MIRILCIDDKPEVLDKTLEKLGNYSGFYIEACINYDLALDKIRNNLFDLVISGISGLITESLNFLCSVRSLKPGIPYIIFSCRGYEEDVICLLNEGADYFVQSDPGDDTCYLILESRIRKSVDKSRTQKGIIEGREEFSTIFWQYPDGIVQIGRDLRICYVNFRFTELTGYKREDILGVDFRRFTRSNGTESLIDQINSVFYTGKSISTEYLFAEEKWFWIIISPYVGPLNDIRKVILSVRDITSQKRAVFECEKYQYDLLEQWKLTNALLEAIPGPVYFIGTDGRYTGCNQAFSEMAGVSRNDLIGKSVDEVWNSKDAAVFKRTDSELIKTGSLLPFPQNITAINGQVYEVIHQKNIVRNHLGVITGIVGSFHDITDYHRVITDLKKLEEQFRMILTLTPDIFAIITPGMEFSYISPAAEYQTGFLKDEIIGPIDRYIHRDDIQRIKQEIRQLKDKPDRSVWAEFRTRKRDGSYLLLAGTAYNAIDNPAINGILVTCRDITLQRTTEKLLSRTEKIFYSLLDHIPAIVLLLDTSGKIIRINPLFSKITRTSQDNTEGLLLAEFFMPEYKPELESMITRIRSSLLPEFGEFRIISESGFVTISSVVCPIIEDEEILIGFIGIDVTEKKELLGKLYETLTRNEVLDQLVTERTEEISCLLDQKDRIILGIAHEFRTPLTPLKCLLPILIEEEKDAKRKEMLTILMNNSMKMVSIVEKILYLAKSGRMHKLVDLNLISIHNLIDKVFHIYREMGDRKKCSLVNKIDKDLVLNISPSYLESIFGNLISNAIKYSKSGGKVRVLSYEDKDKISIIVMDNGIGMTENELDHIFEPFFKADPSRHDRTSPGLGLTMTRKLVDVLGGTISITSQGLGKGTSVTVRFSKENDNSDLSTYKVCSG